jgi:hypothetical protein
MITNNPKIRVKAFHANLNCPGKGLAHFLYLCLFGILLVCQSSHADNFVTRTNQVSGHTWNEAIWTNATTGSITLAVPVAGNSYEVVTNGLIRPPVNTSSAASPIIFPGDSLKFDAGGSIRLKSSGSGASGYYFFNKTGGQLILNGGELDAGDDMSAFVLSTVNVVTNTATRFNAGQDSTTFNSSTSGQWQGFRNFIFLAGLSGGGSLTLGNACMINQVQITSNTVAQFGTNNGNFIFRSTSSSFAGNVTVSSGWIQAAAPGALGSANIIIAGTSNSYPNAATAGPGAMGPAQFSATVDYSNPGNLTIQNTNSFLLLDHNLTFGGAVIDGATFGYGPTGTTNYTAAQINAITGQTNVIDPTSTHTLTIASNVTILFIGPTILSQTASLTNYVGTNISLTVVAAGTQPFSYQWLSGAIGSGIYTNIVAGGNITGFTNSVLTFNNTVPGNQADYVVVITNIAGAVTSSVPTSVYITPLTVIGPTPSSMNLYPGGTAVFNITALGVQISYQWQKIVGGITNTILSATNSSLTINNVGTNDVASYNVVVSTPFATNTSQVAILSLVAAPTDVYGQTVMSLGPLAYWRLGEGAGTNAYDNAGGHDATYGSAADLTFAGPGSIYPGFPSTNFSLGSANGTTNSYATLPANSGFSLNTNTVTIASWVNPFGLQPKVGLVFQRDASGIAGLNLTTNNTLGYTWNNSAASIAWDSGLTLPLNVWSFVVLVVTPTNTTIYMYSPSQQSSAQLVTANAVTPFTGQMTIGDDTQDVAGARILNGNIAEVTIYKRSLSATEVAQLYTAGSGQAVAPIISSQPQSQWVLSGHTAQFSVTAGGSTPLYYQWLTNGVGLVNGGQVSGATNATLSISTVGSGNAVQYSVIVSNSAGSVTSSPAMLTLLTGPSSFQSNNLQLGPLGYWPLNETSGTNAFDYSGNGYHGTYISIGALGATGPNPPYVGFDSIDNLAPSFALASTNSYVSLPSFGVTSSNMSFAAWIYPMNAGGTNNQAPSAGIIFNRSSPASGLCYKNDGNQLGYNWNNDPATFGFASGLIPPTNQWSFVAVVVTPTNATLYLYNTNGSAQSVNTTNHPPVTFTGETRIGSDSQGGRNFNGKIEQAMVFNYSLSANQIAQVYTNGSGMPLVTAPTNANLTISSPSSGSLQLSWTAGTLLEATNVTGPWATNTATSPYTVPTTAPQKFYRVRLQ